MNDILEGKTLVALGDSLIYGNRLGSEVTWVNKLAARHRMRTINYGKNGNPISLCGDAKRPMCFRYEDMEDNADYVVVLGGANDRRLNAPIGENTDEIPTTFKGALNLLIAGLTRKYPRAKILFMTNYCRSREVNTLGFSDPDYVSAMEEICRLWSIPCYNNYANCGISFLNPAQIPWIDEGVTFGEKENHHFSEEAYEWLLPRYEALLAAL